MPTPVLERPHVSDELREVVWPPEVVIDEYAKPLMTPEVVDVLTEFVDLFVNDARTHGVDFDRVDLHDSFDPEDGSNMIVVRMLVKYMSDDDRHAYFHAFGARMQEWYDALDERRKDVFFTWISFITWPQRTPNDV
jgi:hypothetical protein